MHVILVEDNDANREMLSRRLRKKGFDVTPAADGEAGVAAAAAAPPDVVLMDMSLPGIDGLEATRRIKAANPRVPVILLTAHALDGHAEKAAAAGCDGYDTKPVDLDRLLATIAKLTTQKPVEVAPEIDGALFRHDLRTPVNAILGFAELLLDDAEAPEFRTGVTELRALGRQLLAGIDRLKDGDASGLVLRARDGLGPVADRVRAAAVALAGTTGGSVAVDVMSIAAAAERLKEVLAVGGKPAAVPKPVVEPVRDDTAPVPTSPGGDVLIVDDDPVNRQLLARGLHRLGHTFVLAADGATALELMAAHTFDAVLLDLVMPGLSGYDVLLKLKTDPAKRHVPIIVISAHDQLDEVAQCLGAGAEDFLPKPCDPRILRARLAGCLEKKRLRDRELEYLRQVEALTAAASGVEADAYDPARLAPVLDRADALGTLARVFDRMAREVKAREEKLRQQVVQLTVEIDYERKAKQVAEVTETEYFRTLQAQAAVLRGRIADGT